MEFKYIGFIYSKTSYKDSDEIINLISNQDEKVVFKARGILKPNSKNAASCNYFVIGEFILTAKTEMAHKTLKNVSLIKQYHLPYDNLLISGIYFLIYEIIAQIVDQIPIYNLALDCFEKLEKQENPLSVLLYFLKQMNQKLGYQPSLKGCVNCQRKSQLVSFDFFEGGFICKNCFDEHHHRRYPINFLTKIYEFLKATDLYIFDFSSATLLLDVYMIFLKDEAGLHLQSYEFIKKILKINN